MGKHLESAIKIVGDKYKEAPRSLRISIGKILQGKLKIVRK